MSRRHVKLEFARTLYRERALRRVADLFADAADITITPGETAFVVELWPLGDEPAAQVGAEFANHALAATIEDSRR